MIYRKVGTEQTVTIYLLDDLSTDVEPVLETILTGLLYGCIVMPDGFGSVEERPYSGIHSRLQGDEGLKRGYPGCCLLNTFQLRV